MSDQCAAGALALAGRQHDVVLTRQLRDVGISGKVLRRWARDGWLVPVRQGAWTISRQPSAWQQAVAVALLAGPEAALSHSTAARVHRFGHLLAAGEPELSVVYPRGLRLSGVRIHRVASLEEPDVQFQRGVLVTAPARTIVDLAGQVPDAVLARVFDEALIDRLVSAAEVAQALARTRSRPGANRLRRLVEQRLASPGADSHLEARVIEVLGPLAPFEVHYQLVLEGQLLILDIAWPEPKVSIECDGWAVHGRSRSRFDRDRRRDNLLASHGWTTGHVTSSMSDAEILQVAVRLLLRRGTAGVRP